MCLPVDFVFSEHEAIQFLNTQERCSLRDLLERTPLTFADVVKQRDCRTVVRDLLTANLETGTGALHDYVRELLGYMLERGEMVYQWAARQPPRALYTASDLRPAYDPSKGAYYNYVISGQPLAAYPRFTSKENREADSDDCHKKNGYDRHGKRTRAGGIFVYHCLRSQMVLGCHIMPEAEGRRDLAAAVYRFHPGGIEDINSDFACGSGTYMLSRTPHFVRDVDFTNDTFHHYSHTCGSTYCPKDKRYKALINTSLAEQSNAELSILKKLAFQSTVSHTMFATQKLFNTRNRKKKGEYLWMIVAMASTQPHSVRHLET
jgi:hypothetical protein